MSDGRRRSGGDAASIVGCWTLKSHIVQVVDTGERLLPFGDNPRGALILHESGRMAVLITPRDQIPPVGEPEAAKAYGQMIAYSGRYRLEGNRLITDVDVSWMPAWADSSQARTFVVAENELEIISEPGPMPGRGGALAFAVLTFTREA
jgi:Lipocalin-like domain